MPHKSPYSAELAIARCIPPQRSYAAGRGAATEAPRCYQNSSAVAGAAPPTLPHGNPPPTHQASAAPSHEGSRIPVSPENHSEETSTYAGMNVAGKKVRPVHLSSGASPDGAGIQPRYSLGQSPGLSPGWGCPLPVLDAKPQVLPTPLLSNARSEREGFAFFTSTKPLSHFLSPPPGVGPLGQSRPKPRWILANFFKKVFTSFGTKLAAFGPKCAQSLR